MQPASFPYPMLDRVVAVDAGVRARAMKCVSANEPWCQGHFPGQPVFPGTLILESLSQIGAILAYASEPFDVSRSLMYFLGVDKVKFRNTVVPGDRLDLKVDVVQHRTNTWKLSGEATVDGLLAAHAELLASIVDRDR